MIPLLLAANQPPDRFYEGGARIAAFRGTGPGPSRTPEDWVGSATTIRGEASTGLTVLPGGAVLRDELARDPLAWFGPAHAAAFGADPMLLVKLLDAGQRLPVHAHPDGAFARRHLGTAHGKAEAWCFLTPGEVFLALREPVAPQELERLVAAQDVERMLALMHRVRVEAGQTVFVPPGVLHAIGRGVLLVELQEPEDLSILLEWRDFALDGAVDGHLGLGFGTALRAVETRARSAEEVEALVVRDPSDEHVLPAGSRQYFRLERLRVDGTARSAAGFGVAVVVDGSLQLVDGAGRTLEAPRGSTVLLPFSAGDLRWRGSGVVLIARPPLP